MYYLLIDLIECFNILLSGFHFVSPIISSNFIYDCTTVQISEYHLLNNCFEKVTKWIHTFAIIISCQLFRGCTPPQLTLRLQIGGGIIGCVQTTVNLENDSKIMG